MPRLQLVPRVLVVDDDEGVRNFCARALRDGGYDVTVASSGADALVVAGEKSPFDVFVIDVMMPHMTGDELARRLRLADRNVKVLYFTGFSDQLFAKKSTLWQDEAFLDKPVTVSGLREAVSLLLFGHTRGPEKTAP